MLNFIAEIWWWINLRYQGIEQKLFKHLLQSGFFNVSWQDGSLEAGLTQPIDTLMKRSKALRFYGLMGKRSGDLSPQVSFNIVYLCSYHLMCQMTLDTVVTGFLSSQVSGNLLK